MKQFTCQICGYTAKSYAGLRVHQTQKHENNKPEPKQCQICGRLIGAHAFGLHIKKLHNMDSKTYYDTYLKKPNEDICMNCGKPTKFQSMYLGYSNCCSKDCQRRNVWNNMSEQQKQESIKKNSNSVKNYIKNRSKEETSKIMKKIHNSQTETTIINNIKSIYSGEVLQHVKNKKYIYPYELDIVIPDLKLAIEYNGLYWHSTLSNKPKDYHLQKSLLCKEKGIRLIHIYEFEDINEQLKLLQDLILGQDNYPKNDFNKNNFLEIPKPEVVYKDDRYIIYGAGKLY